MDASELTGAGSVLTAATAEPIGDVQEIVSGDGSVNVTNPTGPITDLRVAGGGAFPGFDLLAPPSVAAASAVGVALTAARGDHTHEGVNSVTPGTGMTNSGTTLDPILNVTPPTFPLQTVANVAALAALASAGFQDGTLAYVQTYKAFFALVLSGQPVTANVRVAASGNAGHLWVRCLESSAWWSQLTWFIDPANVSGTASDENTGASNVLPLATWAELGRRFRARNLPGVETNTFNVTLMSDSATTDSVQFHMGTNYRTTGTILVQGTVTPVAVGIIAVAQAKNAATNLPNTINVVGFNWATHVGQIIRLVGTNTTTAVVEADLGGGTAQLGEQNVNGALGAGFTAGQTVELCTLTKLSGAMIEGPGLALQVNDCQLQTCALRSETRTNGITMLRCQVSAGFAVNSGNLGTITGCAFSSGNVTLQGTLGPAMCSFINCPVIEICSPTGFSTNSLWKACGVVNSYVVVDSATNLVFSTDFHTFNAAAGKCVVSALAFSQVTFLAGYYGSGNSITAAGIGIQFGTQIFYQGTKPVNDCGLGLVYDAGASPAPIPSASGTSLAYAALPLALSPKICAMVTI
jgi:hypothetical protein